MNAAEPSTSADREHLIDQVLRANNPTEVRVAWRALDRWMEAHPDDLSMPDAYGFLYRLADAKYMIPEGETMFPLDEPETAEAV